MQEIRIPQGMRDLTTSQSRRKEALRKRIEDVFDSFGYEKICTPTIEYADTYQIGFTSSTDLSEMYRFLDQDGNINPSGALFYHKMLAFAKEQGMDVFMNLYHFDMPTYLFRRGGWESREVVEAYAHYAEMALREFSGE